MCQLEARYHGTKPVKVSPSHKVSSIFLCEKKKVNTLSKELVQLAALQAPGAGCLDRDNGRAPCNLPQVMMATHDMRLIGTAEGGQKSLVRLGERVEVTVPARGSTLRDHLSHLVGTVHWHVWERWFGVN